MRFTIIFLALPPPGEQIAAQPAYDLVVFGA
jgi:hypothetical protein